MYGTSDPDLSAEEALKLPFVEASELGSTHPDMFFWVLYDFQNHDSLLLKSNDWYLEVSPIDYASLFFQSENGIIKQRDFGFLTPMAPYRQTILSYYVPFKKGELIQDRYLLLRIRKVSYYMNLSSFGSRITASFPHEIAKSRFTWASITSLIPDYLFIGAAGIAMIFAFLFYVVRRRKEFLYYSLYLFMLIYYLGRRPMRWHDALFSDFPIGDWMIHMQAQIAINLFYVLFVRHFLNTKNDYPPLNRAIHWAILFLLITMVADFLAIFTENFVAHIYIMDAHRLVMSLFALGGSIYLLVKAKNSLVNFIVFGSLAFTIGALGMLFTSNSEYMIVGSTIEIIMFGAGLGHKLQQITREKQRLELVAVKMELSAMKAQMNPHFIFNSLSSIQHLILSNDRKASLTYLSKFSHLLRRTLDSSVDSSHLLSSEIEMLRNYLELETLRFSGEFSYDVIMEENLDGDTVEIPVFVIQPFVENAIIHGLKPSDRKEKRLTIHFRDGDEVIICTVCDNGIGREASARKSQRGKEYRSHGMAVTLKRLTLESYRGNGDNIVELEDLQNDGIPAGTKVTIRIPKLF